MFSSGAWRFAVRAPGAERRRRDPVAARRPGTSARCPPSRRRCSRGLPVTSSDTRAAVVDDGVARRRPPGGLALALDDLDVGEPVALEVARGRRPRSSAGSWSGTIRMSRRACASAGVTVLGVRLRVAGPQALDVERGLEGERLERLVPVEPADEPRPRRSRVRRSSSVGEVHRPDRRQLVRRSAARFPASRPSTAGRPSSSQKVASAFDQPVGRVRQHDGQARVRVVGDGPADQLQHDHALAAAVDGRAGPSKSSSPPSISAASAPAQVRALVEERVERPAAGLLLALDEVPDPAGERPDRVAVGLERPDPRQELALVVGGAARPRRGRRGSRARRVGSSTARAGPPAGRRSGRR